MKSTIHATNQGNITRLNEFEFIMFFRESTQDKAKRRQLTCVKPFTLRIRFHSVGWIFSYPAIPLHYIGFKVLFDPCGVDGCVEEEGSPSFLLHASTQF
jgi:hypothetical protein